MFKQLEMVALCLMFAELKLINTHCVQDFRRLHIWSAFCELEIAEWDEKVEGRSVRRES